MQTEKKPELYLMFRNYEWGFCDAVDPKNTDFLRLYKGLMASCMAVIDSTEEIVRTYLERCVDERKKQIGKNKLSLTLGFLGVGAVGMAFLASRK